MAFGCRSVHAHQLLFCLLSWSFVFALSFIFVDRCTASNMASINSVQHYCRHTVPKCYTINNTQSYRQITQRASPVYCLPKNVVVPARQPRPPYRSPSLRRASPPPSRALLVIDSRRTGCWGCDFTAATTSWCVSILPTPSGCWTCTNAAKPPATKTSSSPSRRRARALGGGQATCTR